MKPGKRADHQDGTQQLDDNPPVAAALLVGSLFLLGLQDGLIKLTSSHVSMWQMQLIRASGNLMLLLIVAATVWGSLPPAPKRLWAVALRSMFLTTAMVLFFGGVPFLELSEIAAGLYVFPLFVAVLSAVVLGERVGPRRIGAVIVGFTGTLLILKPGTDAFQWISLMPVGAGLCYAATILSTPATVPRGEPGDYGVRRCGRIYFRRHCRFGGDVGDRCRRCGTAMALSADVLASARILGRSDHPDVLGVKPYRQHFAHARLSNGGGKLAGAFRLFLSDLRDVLGLCHVASCAGRAVDPRHGVDRGIGDVCGLAGAATGCRCRRRQTSDLSLA